MKNSENNNMRDLTEKVLIASGWGADDASHCAMIITKHCVAEFGNNEFEFRDGYGSQVNDSTYFEVLGRAVSLAAREEIANFDGEPEKFIAMIGQMIKWGQI